MQKAKLLFYGIKGSGLSALAMYLYDLGYEIEGYDVEKKLFTEAELIQRKIKIFPFPLDVKKSIKEYSLMIYSSSYKEDKEVILIKQLIPSFEYHEFLSRIIRDLKVVGVSGTHGKTTLVGILDALLGRNCSLIEGDGMGRARGELAVVESCEYQDHFLSYNPSLAIILAIELDHTDYFKDYRSYLDSFIQFAKQSKKVLVFDLYRQYFPGAITVGELPHSNYRYFITNRNSEGSMIDFYYKSKVIKGIRIGQPGDYMAKLSAFGLATLDQLGYQIEDHINKLADFKKVKRRMNIEMLANTIIIDDYAHQPSQIDNAFDVANQISCTNKKVCIFLPDRLSRLTDFFNQFVASLNKFDESFIVLADPAKEKLVRKMVQTSKKIKLFNEKVGSNLEPTTYLFLSSKRVDDYINSVKLNRGV